MNYRTKVCCFYRYNVHEPLVNFMAPEPMVLPPMASKLFSNLFGQQAIAPVSWKCMDTMAWNRLTTRFSCCGGSQWANLDKVAGVASIGWLDIQLHTLYISVELYFFQRELNNPSYKLQSQSWFCNCFLHYAWRSIVLEELWPLYPGDV